MPLFNKGDKVNVVGKVPGPDDLSSAIWVQEMDEYLNDGKEYVVLEDTDLKGDTKVKVGEGEGWLDYWYFPPGSLRLSSASLLSLVQEIPAYVYNGHTYTHKQDLIGTIANDFISRFTDGEGISEKSIDQLIKDMENLKELCQKLK